MYAFPRGSPRSESEWVYLKYCFASAWLLSNFPAGYLLMYIGLQHMQVFSLFSSFVCVLVVLR